MCENVRSSKLLPFYPFDKLDKLLIWIAVLHEYVASDSSYNQPFRQAVAADSLWRV